MKYFPDKQQQRTCQTVETIDTLTISFCASVTSVHLGDDEVLDRIRKLADNCVLVANGEFGHPSCMLCFEEMLLD